MKFQKDHPSSNKLYLVEREKLAVPCVNYLDFPDAKKFGGTCIDAADISHLGTNELVLVYMEQYAIVACVLFCPFLI